MTFDFKQVTENRLITFTVLNNTDHVLHHLLTPVHNTSHSYSFRPRAHDRELPDRLTHLTDCNFIIRMLFYQVY